MHVGTTQLLRLDDLAGSHLHKGRSTEICLGLVLDEDGIVGQRWVISAASGGSPKDDCARRLAVLGAHCQVVEELASFVEDAELLRQEYARLAG